MEYSLPAPLLALLKRPDQALTQERAVRGGEKGAGSCTREHREEGEHLIRSLHMHASGKEREIDREQDPP